MKRRKIMNKFYCLYNNANQEKLLTTATDEEGIKIESEYFSSGVWFEYESKENSNLLENEKELTDIVVFPKEPKTRERLDLSEERKINFKWVK